MRQAADLLRAQIRNLVDEMHRQVACYLTTNYKLIYLPTFETSEMTIRGRRKLNRKSVRQMLGWAHYRFKQVLKSQAMRRGVLVVDTNEAFTSKTCTKCGHIHRHLGGAKVFKCPKCGYQVDRDWGGARNNLLRALGDSPLSLSNEREAIVVNFLSLQQFTA